MKKEGSRGEDKVIDDGTAPPVSTAGCSPKDATIHLLREQRQLRDGQPTLPQETATTTGGGASPSAVYVVATHDEELLDELRGWGTVPLVRLANNSVLILEQPSRQGQRQQQGKELQKWKRGLPQVEQELVEFVKKTHHTSSLRNSATATTGGAIPASLLPSIPRNSSSAGNGHQRRTTRVKGKAKGPNPLSCKRKRSSDTGDGSSGRSQNAGDSGTSSSSKRRRERANIKPQGTVAT
jgi:hypothetical protein